MLIQRKLYHISLTRLGELWKPKRVIAGLPHTFTENYQSLAFPALLVAFLHNEPRSAYAPRLALVAIVSLYARGETSHIHTNPLV